MLPYMIIKIKEPENIGLYSLSGKDYFHNESPDLHDLDFIDLSLYRENHDKPHSIYYSRDSSVIDKSDL